MFRLTSLIKVLKHKFTISKFSTNTSIVVNIPSNLKLADPSVLVPPKVIEIPKLDYTFPRLYVQPTVPVIPFDLSKKISIEINSTAPLDAKVFGAAIRKDIILDVVRYHQLKMRQPYKTKRKSEIRGSNKKPHPQKGTGRAQAGHKRNAIWRGGHKAHGPVLRDFSIQLNRKVRAQGMMIALAAKLLEGNLIVVDEMKVETIKTKLVYSLLKAHDLHEKQCLLVDVEFQNEFMKSSQNLPKVTLLNQMEAHVYEIVRNQKLIITSKALEMLQKRILDQYYHQGKRRTILRDITSYRDLVEKGKALGPQTGIPFQQPIESSNNM